MSVERPMLAVFAPTHFPTIALVGSPIHSMSRPLGALGQPPPVHVPVLSKVPAQSHVTLRSTHQCSPLNDELVHTPFVPQSPSRRHGSQPLPVPTHFPKRCAQVAWPKSESQVPHVAASPHGQEGCFGSHNWVQIFAPL